MQINLSVSTTKKELYYSWYTWIMDCSHYPDMWGIRREIKVPKTMYIVSLCHKNNVIRIRVIRKLMLSRRISLALKKIYILFYWCMLKVVLQLSPSKCLLSIFLFCTTINIIDNSGLQITTGRDLYDVDVYFSIPIYT